MAVDTTVAPVGPRTAVFPGQAVLAASAAHTASFDSGIIDGVGAAGVIVVINVTASAATPSVVFTIRGLATPAGDGANPTYVEYDILSSAAVTGAGTTVLAVHPAITDEANKRKAFPLPDKFYVHAEAADADSLTYSISLVLTN